jgi:hypothetical protein
VIVLGVAIVALGGAVVLVGMGGVGRMVGAVGDAFGGFVDEVTTTPSPSPTPGPELDPPTIAGPADPYTNQPTVSLQGTVAPEVVGDPDLRLRIYVTLPGGAATEVKEVAVPATATFTVPDVALVAGANDFTATIVGPDYESEPSAVVTYVLDTTPPEIVLVSPADGSTVNRPAVEISGRTQSLSAIAARNEATGGSATATAGGDGSFTIVVPIELGPNGITVTVTDPAGNVASSVVTVSRGDGRLSADISASAYRISRSKLPAELTVRVAVTDPDGRPLEGATVLFTIQVTGIPPIVPSPVTTDGAGVAAFRTVIPAAATAGSGPITARITTAEFGEIRVQTSLTITD